MATRQAVLLLATLSVVSALTVKIDPREEECFIEETTVRDVQLKIVMQVTHGGQLDIDLSITDPSGMRIHQQQRVTESKHEWTAKFPGKYKVCFSNKMARWTPKWVSFYYVATDSASMNKGTLDPIEQGVFSLQKGVNEMHGEQMRLRAIERAHREQMEESEGMVLTWAVFQSVLLITMGLLQMYYLKRFLEVKQSI
eukprot:Rhum_TRINITY_DN4388_c0_g1::Rhum_TRINITY_DN4388_c0_g1_i1::g.14143::m.14143/K20347/TMED2, EMP24; p24 family protein beta-1